MASTMQSSATTGSVKPKPVITEQDVVFTCPSCEGELVVDREGVGMECLCAHCGFPLVVPEHSTVLAPSPAPAPAPAPVASVPVVPTPVAPPRLPAAPTPAAMAAPRPQRHFDFGSMDAEQVSRRLEELKHQLKENMSQDTEMRGHVNRATIELHRLQLRHKKLQDRQADIEAEILAAKSWIASSAA